MESTQHPRPVSLALVNDHPVIIDGVARMLEGHPELTVVQLDSHIPPGQSVDLALLDAFASKNHGEDHMVRLLEDPRCLKVVVYTWNVQGQQVDRALDLGVHGYLSKELTAEQLASALLRIHRGERLVDPTPARKDIRIADWPGREVGLSPREAEVIALITQGATNEEIARDCYLSINSVKSYIRSAYRKMGVARRSQAVLWGVQHGMQLTVVHSSTRERVLGLPQARGEQA